MKVKKNKFSTILNSENPCGSKTFRGRGATPKQLFTAKNRHFAFTLAEILVVVTILGVIASITISSAVNNATRKATVVKVLRAYSDLNKAFDEYLVYNNNASMVSTVNDTKFRLNYENLCKSDVLYHEVLLPYFQVTKECYSGKKNGEGRCNYTHEGYGSGRGCFAKKCYYLNSSAIPEKGVSFSPCSSTGWAFDWHGAYRRFKVKAGYSVAVQEIRSIGANLNIEDGNDSIGSFRPAPDIPVTTLITVDVNGDKSPNTLGKDMFVFTLTPKGIFPVPLGTYGCDPKSKDGNKNKGFACSGYIIKNKNMDYLK